MCLIVLASFVIFVVNQTSAGSTHQQEELNSDLPAPATVPGAPPAAAPKHKGESSVHKAIDEASKALTSPFSAVTAGSSSEWLIRIVNVALALLVYGFGLGFLARLIRVRL